MRIVRLLTTLLMFGLNRAAMALPLNGLSTKELSDLLFTLITPAGFTFAIRSVIYLGIIAVSFLLFTKRVTFPKKFMRRYVLSALMNGLWIVAWHYQNLHLSMIIILVLLVSLIVMDQIIKSSQSLLNYYGFVRNVFLLYFGWVQIATLLMTTIYAIYQLQIIDNQNLIRPIAILCLAGVINLVVLRKERNITTSLVAIRALRGIINGQTQELIVQVSRLVMLILVINIAWFSVRRFLIKKA